MHASVNGAPVRVWTGQDLMRQAKNRAMWAQFGIALISAAGSAAAASQRYSYHGSFATPRGVYSYSGSYPSLAGQLQANAIMNNGIAAMGFVQQKLDYALANIDDG